MKDKSRVYHEFGPLFQSNSSVLILGSMPSVRSRQEGFYYMHPQNRFWTVLSDLLKEPFPKTIQQRKEVALGHGVALWDVLESCVISGSSDASIKNPRVNPIAFLLQRTNVKAIYTNGKAAEKYYRQYVYSEKFPPCRCLPSTSSANAQWSLNDLLKAWSVILQHCFDF